MKSLIHLVCLLSLMIPATAFAVGLQGADDSYVYKTKPGLSMGNKEGNEEEGEKNIQKRFQGLIKHDRVGQLIINLEAETPYYPYDIRYFSDGDYWSVFVYDPEVNENYRLKLDPQTGKILDKEKRR